MSKTTEKQKPPTFEKLEVKNGYSPESMASLYSPFYINKETNQTSNESLYQADCEKTLLDRYHARQFYETKHATNLFSILYKGTKTMYQAETIKLCQYVKCMNIAYVSKHDLLQVLRVEEKNLVRTLNRMIERKLLKHYTYNRQDKVYSIVINPCLFFKGDYNLKDALVRIHLKQETRITDYRTDLVHVDNVGCKDSYDSSKQVKETYKAWIKDNTNQNFKLYMQAIEEDKKRECFTGSKKKYKQEYKRTNKDTNFDRFSSVNFDKMSDLDFRLKFIV